MKGHKPPQVIVLGNEKGGSGKSTTAIHLVVGLLRLGYSVGCIDLDLRQGSLARYLENRTAFCEAQGRQLPMPGFDPKSLERLTQDDGAEALEAMIQQFKRAYDIVLIDTPGNDTPLTRLAHGHADALITPINDSFVDLDVLAQVDGKTMDIRRLSHYADLIWKQKMEKAQRDGGSIDWVVVRNRLSSLDSHNRQEVGRVLRALSERLGFRCVPGFGERVIYREMFPLGLTMMDLRDVNPAEGLKPSHLAARQEVRTLIEALRLRRLAPQAASS